jgi:hypothetical protein
MIALGFLLFALLIVAWLAAPAQPKGKTAIQPSAALRVSELPAD